MTDEQTQELEELLQSVLDNPEYLADTAIGKLARLKHAEASLQRHLRFNEMMVTAGHKPDDLKTRKQNLQQQINDLYTKNNLSEIATIAMLNLISRADIKLISIVERRIKDPENFVKEFNAHEAHASKIVDDIADTNSLKPLERLLDGI